VDQVIDHKRQKTRRSSATWRLAERQTPPKGTTFCCNCDEPEKSELLIPVVCPIPYIYCVFDTFPVASRLPGVFRHIAAVYPMIRACPQVIMLAAPKIVALDSATLGKVALDYWSDQMAARDRARSFVTRLKDSDVFIAFTLTHVCELLRHDNDRIVRNRMAFLRSLPLIAWLRPYCRNWFPGGIPDLFCRELHAVLHGSAATWQDIIGHVRGDLWETGTGAEMFVENDRLWAAIRALSKRQRECEAFVASISRTNPSGIANLKIGKIKSKQLSREVPPRPQVIDFITRDIQKQLHQHCDPRLSPEIAANKFAHKTFRDLDAIYRTGGDSTASILNRFNIPPECVNPQMTVADLGELAIYAVQLKTLCTRLRPIVTTTMKEVPPAMLPSYVLQRRLSNFQSTANRVSGSDMGDGHVAPLIFYAYDVEVDKRTLDFLNRIRKAEPKLAAVMGTSFRSSDYMRIPERFETPAHSPD
jgi:hypothetical protein